MARLNEVPAAPAESVESLKRRFVRQNREIARANSIQSLRIRNLEAEVSRLLAENVALRKEVISLTQDLEKSQGSERIDTGISNIREKLEAKLSEISSIVSDLGNLSKRESTNATTVSSSERFSRITDQLDSADELGGESNVQVVRSACASLGGVLPVIQEDKLYPRLSLGSDVNAEDGDDFDGQQQMEGPASYCVPTSPEKPEPEVPIRRDDAFVASEPEQDDPVHISDSPPSLEIRKRRKRRDSSLLKDIIPKADTNDPLHNHPVASPQKLKVGRKRKFSVSQDEEPVPVPQNYQADDFQFTRVSEKPRQVPRDDDPGPENLLSKSSLKNDTMSRKQDSIKASRHVLKPKSANTDPRSPVKRRAHALGRSVGGKDLTEKPPQTSKLTSIYTTSVADRPNVVEIRRPEKLLKAPNDPGNTLLSNGRSESKDLKSRGPSMTPELDIGRNNAKPLERSRHPRRSRGAVSYAEPNLRDKMRRPTEELVDAVTSEAYRRVSKPLRESPSKSGIQQGNDAKENTTVPGEGLETGTVADCFALSSSQKPNVLKGKTVDLVSTADSGAVSTTLGITNRPLHDNRQSATKAELDHHWQRRDEAKDTVPSDPVESTENVPRQQRRHSSNPACGAGGKSNGPRGAGRHLAETTSEARNHSATLELYQSTPQDDNSVLSSDILQTHDGGSRAQRLSTRRRTTVV